jgi:hypothetical protein
MPFREQAQTDVTVLDRAQRHPAQEAEIDEPLGARRAG